MGAATNGTSTLSRPCPAPAIISPTARSHFSDRTPRADMDAVLRAYSSRTVFGCPLSAAMDMAVTGV